MKECNYGNTFFPVFEYVFLWEDYLNYIYIYIRTFITYNKVRAL